MSKRRQPSRDELDGGDDWAWSSEDVDRRPHAKRSTAKTLRRGAPKAPRGRPDAGRDSDVEIVSVSRARPQPQLQDADAEAIFSGSEDDAGFSQKTLSGSQSGIQREPAMMKWLLPNSQKSNTATTDPAPAMSSETQLWVDKYFPATEDEICVHKRKVGEVRTWLTKTLDAPETTRNRLLILAGPSGAGKTAVIRMLMMELNFEIVEWVNPINTNLIISASDSMEKFSTKFWTVSSDERKDVRRIGDDHTTVIQHFQQFLSVASRTPALSFSTEAHTQSESDLEFSQSSRRPLERSNRESADQQRKIILIEDLPNVSNPTIKSAFQSSLRHYVNSPRSRFPVVLIVSDTVADSDNNWRSFETAINFRSIVPEDVAKSPGCTRISFNPVAPTLLTKALSRILASERLSKATPKSEIDAVVAASGGDIRCAINAMQFALVGRSIPMFSAPMKRTVKRKRTEASEAAPDIKLDYVGGREVNLVLFHALGKVLNGKRLLGPNEAQDQFPGMSNESSACASIQNSRGLPPHLSHNHRLPAKSNPEHVFASSHLEAGSFNAFLAENYPNYFASIEECVTVCDNLARSDQFLGKFRSRVALAPYAASTSARGLMFARTNQVPSIGFHKMRKPECFKVNSEALENMEAVVSAGRSWWTRKPDTSSAFTMNGPQSASALCHDILPHMAIIDAGLRSRRDQPPHQNRPLHGLGMSSHEASLLRTLSSYSLSRPTAAARYVEVIGESEVLDFMDDVQLIPRGGGVGFASAELDGRGRDDICDDIDDEGFVAAFHLASAADGGVIEDDISEFESPDTSPSRENKRVTFKSGPHHGGI